MKRYPAYKDSGIDWVGQMPKHWKRIKFKYITTLMTCGHAATPTYVEEGGKPFLSAQNIKNEKVDLTVLKHITVELHEQLTKNHKVEKGDILQVRVGGADTIGQTAISDLDFEFSIYVSLAHIKLNALAYNGFVKHLCNSKEFKNYCGVLMKKGAGVANLNVSDVEILRIPLPSIEEQIAIAAYLDQKTKQIDSLIKNKEKLIELLKEERTAIINQAVTKGLNPHVPMKESGIKWLGKIPEHWAINRIASLAECITGYAFKSDSFSFDGGTKLVRGDNVTEGHLRWGDKTRYWNEVTPDLEKFLLDEFDILIGMDGSKVGKNFAMVNAKDLPLLLVQRVARIRTKSPLIAKLISHTVSTYNFRYYINLSKTDPAIPHITLKNIKDYIVLMPPLDELEELICQLESNIQRIDSTLDKVQKEIELLKEYKTTLISEVVTGKIDVREEVLELA